MRFQVIIFLAITGCNNLLSEDYSESVLCGWYRQEVNTLPDNGKCWLIEPPPGYAATPMHADSCDAGSWTEPSVWQSGDRVQWWQNILTQKKVDVYSVPIECPIQ